MSANWWIQSDRISSSTARVGELAENLGPAIGQRTELTRAGLDGLLIELFELGHHLLHFIRRSAGDRYLGVGSSWTFWRQQAVGGRLVVGADRRRIEHFPGVADRHQRAEIQLFVLVAGRHQAPNRCRGS